MEATVQRIPTNHEIVNFPSKMWHKIFLQNFTRN